MTAVFVATHLGDPITATARRYPSERVANVLRGTLHPFLRFIESLHTLIWAALLSFIGHFKYLLVSIIPGSIQ